MRTGWRMAVLLLLVVAATACASAQGFDRRKLHADLAEPVVVNDEEIRVALEAKPQLPSPFKLALAFQPLRGQVTWRLSDKQVVLDAAEALAKSGVVSSAIVVDVGEAKPVDNRAARLAAARAGADAVLVIRGTSDTDKYNNVLGVTYVALVPALFVPGTVMDGLFMTNASLWDVRNEYLYLSAESEGTASQTRPPMFIREWAVLSEAKERAVAALAEEVASRLASMR